MKLQFSIAGVMLVTVVVALGLWSMLYAKSLVATMATSSLLAGGAVGWIVGFSYGRARAGCIGGICGALFWVCAAVLSDLHFWNRRADPIFSWIGLAACAALGAVPLASTVAVYGRSANELVFRPALSCVIAMLIPVFPAAVGAGIVAVLDNQRPGGVHPILIIAFFSILLAILCGLAGFVGAGHGAAALLARTFVEQGRRYRNARISRSTEEQATIAEHTDPATADRQ